MGNFPFGVNYGQIVRAFEVDSPKILWVKQVGPDDALGKVVDAKGNKYVLWGRDYMDDVDKEATELRLRFGVVISEWMDAKGYKDKDGVLRPLYQKYPCRFANYELGKIKSWHPRSRRFRGVSPRSYRWIRWV